MRSFLTGSQAYGTPTKESDVDLVVAVDTDTYYKLWDLSDDKKKLVFGKLNLVAFNIDRPEEVNRYKGWKRVKR